MHITGIRLQGIRCFGTVDIDLTRGARDAKRWLVVVGDNGAGKTTLLRSIAIGLCDETGAASLLQDVYGDLIQKGQDTATIELELITRRGVRGSVATHLKRGYSGTQLAGEKTIKGLPETFWRRLFVCGYGADRGIEGSNQYEQYAAPDALYTLFNYDWALQNPELMIYRRSQSRPLMKDRLLDELCDILGLQHGSIRLTKEGFSIKNFGENILWGASADGYRATITLILDMLGWFLLSKANKPLEKLLRGIILIDEIEQHLHPELQRGIIARLHKVFPNIQFIVTSHSPICAAGLADLDDSNCSLELLRTNGEGWVVNEPLSTMRGWRYDQVLTSSAFGLTGSQNLGTERLLEGIRRVYMKAHLTKADEVLIAKLMKELERQSPEAADVEKTNVNMRKIGSIRSSMREAKKNQ